MIVAINLIKKRISMFMHTIEHTIELHPLSPTQCRCFHIVGCFNNRNTNLLKFTIATTVLKWRHQQHLGFAIYDFLNISIKSTTTIGYCSSFHLLMNPRKLLKRIMKSWMKMIHMKKHSLILQKSFLTTRNN